MHMFVVSTKSRLTSPKLVTLFLSLFDRSQISHFWNFFYKTFGQLNIQNLGGPRACWENWKKNWKKNLFFAEIFTFSYQILILHILSFFRYITLLCQRFWVFMCFGLKNINFEYFHTTASFIKNLLHLRVILIPMARQMSKYTTGNKLWSLWGCFGYLCSLKNLRVKLTLSRLITSFQILPEIGLSRWWK